ncbi:MAG: CocE/NonD family hydrolase C-terminal non-catalytic domain-containing protein [Actinomycetota bacterium]|nr:CocE/NonD family hydrolase C-terminal non-catalytic domain-containing protein [Actinomycetota bacterium]
MYRICAQHHRFDDEWMHERSGYWNEGDIEIPVYVGSGWEYAVGLHLRGVFDVFWQARGPRRMHVGPPQVPYRPYSSWRIESLRWYDRWLKGIDTGVEDDPLESGKIYEFQTQIWPISNVFHPGHCIRIEISSADSQYQYFPSPYIGKAKIHGSPEHPPKITLPVVDSEIAFDKAERNLQFAVEFGSMYATRGKDKIFSDANEYVVK